MDPGLLLHVKCQSERTFVVDSEREELRNSTEEAPQTSQTCLCFGFIRLFLLTEARNTLVMIKEQIKTL